MSLKAIILLTISSLSKIQNPVLKIRVFCTLSFVIHESGPFLIYLVVTVSYFMFQNFPYGPLKSLSHACDSKLTFSQSFPRRQLSLTA